MTMQISRKPMIGGLTLVIAVISLTACSGGLKTQTPAPQSTTAAQIPTVIVTTVESRELKRQVRLPGQLQAYQDTPHYPKLPRLLEFINVDRGSPVHRAPPLP